MNKITLEINKSIYEIYDEDYEEIKIDGKFTNEYFSELLKDKEIRGLVPPYSGWMINSKDEKYVIKLLGKEEKVICPILICPDDQDFTCTTILVEIENKGSLVKWKRIGYDKGYKYPDQNTLGNIVDWKQDLDIEFDDIDYSEVINKIRLTTASTWLAYYHGLYSRFARHKPSQLLLAG